MKNFSSKIKNKKLKFRDFYISQSFQFSKLFIFN